MSLSMNHVAVLGYSALFIFSLTKLQYTINSPADLLANLLLLTGLGSLITYHVKLIQTGKDINEDPVQKQLRLIAHSTITIFLLATLTPYTFSTFRFYDWFALLGHSSLFVSVLRNMSQLFGVGMLALYFIGASIRAGSKEGLEMLQAIGRLLMTIFFVTAFIQGVTPK
jgi:predicted membrane channel-forming protein YqfA (hemolysin III family)